MRPNCILGIAWGVFTLDVNGSCVSTGVHQATQEDGHVSDVAFGECGRILGAEMRSVKYAKVVSGQNVCVF